MKQRTIQNPIQILDSVKEILTSRNLKLGDVFFTFDQDDDTFLNKKEFASFLNKLIPEITPSEVSTVIELLNPYKIDNPLISLYQLLLFIREEPYYGNLSKSTSIKQLFNKDAQENIQEKSQTIDNQIELQASFDQDASVTNKLDNQLDHKFYLLTYPDCKGVKEFVVLFNELQAQDQLFEDKDFPPNDQSLGPAALKQIQNKKYKITWKRPKDFQPSKKETTKSEWTLFRTDGENLISPQDIKQGLLGDCYFLSAISSLANKQPQSIDDLFITKKTNKYGIYGVYFYISGFQQVVWVDDYFPCNHNGPLYCSSLEKEFWVMILEKAWAKVFGSYSNIISGLSSEVFKALTGGVTWKCSTDSEDFDQQFKIGFDKKAVMVAGSDSINQKPNIEQFGFVPGHAYSVLKMYNDPELQQIQKDVQLIKLRNPWGEKEWIGDWSDESKLWTPELKEKYKLENRNDGVFYISLNDFKQFFSVVNFLYYKDNYKTQTIKICPKQKHALYFQVDIQKKGEYFVSVIQQDKRFHKNLEDNYQYSEVKMALIQDQTFKQYEGKVNQDEQVWIGSELKKRIYILYIKVDWIDGKEREMALNWYGENQISSIKEIPKVPNLFHNLFKVQSKTNPNWKQYGQSGISRQIDFNNSKGFGYIAIDNKSQKTFENKIVLKNLEGLKFKKPDRGNQFNIKVLPGETRVLVGKVIADKVNCQLQEAIKIY